VRCGAACSRSRQGSQELYIITYQLIMVYNFYVYNNLKPTLERFIYHFSNIEKEEIDYILKDINSKKEENQPFNLEVAYDNLIDLVFRIYLKVDNERSDRCSVLERENEDLKRNNESLKQSFDSEIRRTNQNLQEYKNYIKELKEENSNLKSNLLSTIFQVLFLVLNLTLLVTLLIQLDNLPKSKK
jgi:hypothetical protein